MWQLRRLAVTLSNFPTANLPLMRECETDFKACHANRSGAAGSAAPAGTSAGFADANLLTCLNEKRDGFSDRCRDKAFSLEKLAHREFSYNAQARDALLPVTLHHSAS